ncbi:MAG: hypothetical protein WCO44_12300 [Bacteroidota bacterium]
MKRSIRIHPANHLYYLYLRDHDHCLYLTTYPPVDAGCAASLPAMTGA